MRFRKGKFIDPFHFLPQKWNFILIVALFLLSSFFFFHAKISRYFPVKTVKIYGIQFTNQEQVKVLLRPLVSNGFFSINIDYIRDRLMQMPWISEIYVRRNWPDQLTIIILEKQVAARWNNHYLLSKSGEIFLPEQFFASNLPEFIGPDGKQMIMLQYFEEINRVLHPLRAKISTLELTQYSTWKLKLDNGITLQIGHKDILTRLSHFVKVFPKIVGQHTTDVDYIDLRYSNGIAVRWKSAGKDRSV